MEEAADKAVKAFERREGDCVVVTLNSVYVLRDGVCAAVRSRSSAVEEWDAQHRAIGLVSQGGWLFVARKGLEIHPQVEQGDRLCLTGDSDEMMVVTSEVVATAIAAKPPRKNLSEIEI